MQGLCQTLYDTMRAVLILKYGYKDKSPNPCQSPLTEHAKHLIDAPEEKSRAALLNADRPDLEQGMNGMGLETELEKVVKKKLPKQKS